MSDFTMDSYAHTIGQDIAHTYKNAVDTVAYDAADPHGDAASAYIVLKNGVSAELHDCNNGSRVTVVAEIMAHNGEAAYFADAADFADGCAHAVSEIISLMSYMSLRP